MSCRGVTCSDLAILSFARFLCEIQSSDSDHEHPTDINLV
jgi:hypothetical protein